MDRKYSLIPTVVSVIIPAYNAEKYIEQAIQSTTSQSLKNIEIIVINDGSNDSTQHIIEKLALNDNRIILINQANSGKPSIARNAGIAIATGKYIAFLDADDIMQPGKLEAQSTVFESGNDISLVFHDWSIITNEGKELSSSRLKQINFLENAADYLTQISPTTYTSNDYYYNFASTHTMGIHTITVMVRRDTLHTEEEWFPEDMDIGEDLDLWFRILARNKVAFINKVYCQYRKHPSSITKNPERMIIGLITASTRNLERGRDRLSNKDVRLIKNQLSKKYANLGYYYNKKNNKLNAIRYFIKCFMLQTSFKHMLSILKTLTPFSSAK